MSAAWGWIVAFLLAVAAVLLAAGLYRARRTRPAVSSDIDELTGLYSRRAFYAMAAQVLKDNPGRDFLLVFSDLDRFKVYNDLFGTQEGDKLLSEFGQALKGLFGPGSLAGRMEADNFAVLCPREGFDAQRDVAAIAQWLHGYRDDYNFSVSAGIYPIEDPGLDVALMCDRAMLASGTVKHGYGVKFAYYDQSLRDRLMLEQEIVGQMAQALEAGEFQVYYQPQYSFSTGHVVGAEALVRWQRPNGQRLSPSVFIPLFEKNGFITRLDEYVWTQVCRQMRDWAQFAHMADLPVSVNVSRMDIYNPNLPETIRRLAAEYGVAVEKLRLEITESAYVDNPEQLVEVVERLKRMGFYIEMDDFGSGYSSLNTLKDVPVDLLKLDLRFLAGQNNAKGGNILSSVVRMAHWLSLPVVAEGVETRSQAEFLLSIGCDYMQGFYFARPMPAQRLEELMRRESVASMTRGQVHSAQLDANQFWNPDSQATLIFNSYVGGAAIFEYSPGCLEALRINEQYLKVVHMDQAEYQPYRKNLLDWFYEADREACERMLERAAETGEGEGELHFRPMAGKGMEGTWVHMRVRLLSKGQSSSIFYALLEETTRQRALSEQLNAIIKSVPGGIAMYQITSKVRTVFFNDTVAQMSGMTRAEYQAWAGEDAMVAVHPDDREMVAAKVRLLMESPNLSHIECTYRVLRKDGGFWWAQLSASAMRRDGGGLFASAIYLDVSEAVMSRKRSQQNERALWRLYDTVPCGIVRYGVDQRARLGFINRTGLRILGYDSQEAFERATGGSLMAAVYPGDSDYCYSLMQKMLSVQDAVDFEHRVKRPDGQVRWIRGSAERVVDEESGAVIQSVFYDSTLERVSHKERAISQYGKALFSVFDEVFLVDYANRTCRALFARGTHARQSDEPRNLDEALDKWLNFIHPCDRERVDKLFRNCPNEGGSAAEGEVYRVIAQREEVRFCQSTMLLIDGTSALIGHKDVSGRIQAEQALKDHARLLGAQQEQERYRIIVEQTGAAVAEWNRALKSVYRSPSLAAYALGQVQPQDTFKLKVLRQVVHPADAGELRAFWQQIKSGAAKAERLIRLKMADGSYHYSKVSGYIVRDQAGHVSRVIGTITDIEDAVSDRREKEALAERMENIIANLPVGVGIYELGEKVYPRFASDRLMKIFGYQRGEMDRLIRHHMPLETPFYPDGGRDLKRWLEAKTFDQDVRLPRADGGKAWVRIQGSLKTKGEQVLCYAVFSDITGEVRCQQARVWQDERFRIVNTMNQAMIFDYEPADDRLTFYPHGGQGDGREQVLEHYRGQYLFSGRSRVAAGSLEEFSRAIRQALAGQKRGALEFEADLGAGKGWYRASWVGVSGEEGRVDHVVGRVEDIRRERALRRKAEYDQVTGLYNRATTMELMQRALDDEALRPACVFAVLDVDNFKEINDTYGHLRGDQLLRAIAQLLKGRFRACDVAGRVGGDEFVLLLKQIPPEVAIKKLKALAVDIHGLTAQLKIDHIVSLSIGIYPLNGDDREPAQVFGRADAALYAAKRQGKDNCQVYRPDMEMTRQRE